MKTFKTVFSKENRISSKEQFFTKLNFILFTFIIIFSALKNDNCVSQPLFQQTIGTTSNDGASSVIQTSDSGFVFTGSTFVTGTGSFGEIYTAKLSSNGSLLWRSHIGGAGVDFGSSVIQTIDGGFILTGFTSSPSAGQMDIYIQKLSSSGVLIWDKKIGSAGSEYGYSVIQTIDGGFAIAGYTNSFGAGDNDFYIVKLDTGGTVQWSKTAGGTGSETAYSVIQTTDNGYIIAGSTNSFGTGLTDLYFVKLDSGGSLQWSRTIGGTGSEEARSVIRTMDGGFVAAGYTNSFGAGGEDSYIVKFNSAGILQWSKTIGGTADERINSIIQMPDSSFVFAGYTTSFGAGAYDMNIVKLNNSGSLQWSKTIGGPSIDNAVSITKTFDGGYAITGGTYSFGAGLGDIYFVKIDGSGNACGNFSSYTPSSGTGGTTTSPVSIVSSQTPIVLIPSLNPGISGSLSTLCLVGIEPVINGLPGSFELNQNYPNPFNPVTKIKFTLSQSSFTKLVIYNSLGSEVATLVSEQLNAGIHEADLDGSKLSSGIYYYQLTAGNLTETKKMILVK